MPPAVTHVRRESQAAPFLKWAGGKRRLLGELRKRLPPRVELLRHVEPFAGGAALYFAVGPRRALLADINGRLIATYAAVRDELDNVLAHLRELERRHAPPFYYEIRSKFNAHGEACNAEAAAWFIYLNKTCFNGLYRENRRGEFNVPCGRYAAPCILDEAALRVASAALVDVPLRSGPFERTLAELGAGDFVYLDPPYHPTSPTANFCTYAANGFDQAQQEALAVAFGDLARRGAHVMLSNSDTPFTRELYRGWPLRRVQIRRSVSCASRNVVTELIVTSYEPRLQERSRCVPASHGEERDRFTTEGLRTPMHPARRR